MESNLNFKLVENILNNHNLNLHGYCSFDLIADGLIPCRALSRLNMTFSSNSPAHTIIAILFPYKFGDERGNLSRYARVPDYHIAAGHTLEETCKSLLMALPEHRFISFIDNSPIPEVRAAALAGLGIIGDHGLLINPIFGSWVFIGTIITDLDFNITNKKVELCEHCGACAAKCTSGCIGSKSRDDCVSRITQTKGRLEPYKEKILVKSGMVWGCDRCQEVCPHNVNARINPHPCFGCVRFGHSLSKDILSDLSNKAYGWRGISVLKRNLELINSKKPK